MLTRTQLLLLAGTLLLTVFLILFFCLRRIQQRQQAFLHHRRSIVRIPRDALPLLRRCLSVRTDAPAFAALHSLSQTLTEDLLRLKHDLRCIPRLPAGSDEPRMMELARQIAANNAHSAAQLTAYIADWDVPDVSERERAALPLCVAAAHWEHLRDILRVLLTDERERKCVTVLAGKLCRSHHPLTLLNQQTLTLTALHHLLFLARTQHQDMLLEIIGDWLSSHGLDEESVASRALQRQTMMINDMMSISASLKSLRIMDWQSACEDISPLHRLLLQDPAEVYPHMHSSARRDLRMKAERLASVFARTSTDIVNAALSLSAVAERQTISQQVGFYLLTIRGRAMLRHNLACNTGRLYCFCHAHPLLIKRLLLWSFSLLCAFPFLHTHHPLSLLPAFLILIGCIPRAILQRIGRVQPIQAMELPAITPELRTLVILPAMLLTREDALHALRSLKISRYAFPDDGVDCLLLSDFGPCITPHSADDTAILTAVGAGIAALCEEASSGRFFCLHRSRSRTSSGMPFGARGGRSGAIETVCRLVAQGECEDLFDFATISPADLHRQYAFVLILDPQLLPAPGMLESLLSAASHPMNTRFPTSKGFRGYSCFKPVIHTTNSQRCSADVPNRIRLIRPDAYLESLDGCLSPAQPDPYLFLSDALSGCLTVENAQAYSVSAAPLLSLHLRKEKEQIHRHWRIANWLLPWVNTPFGLLRNPLSSVSRFSLRESLRSSVLPLCQYLLLIWSLLMHRFPLMLLTLFTPAAAEHIAGEPLAPSEWFHKITHLPTRAIAAVIGAVTACCPRLKRFTDEAVHPDRYRIFEACCQGIAVLIALTAALLQPFGLPALLPATLFALYPVLHIHEARQLIERGVLSEDDEPFLREIAQATWRNLSTEPVCHAASIPIDLVQSDPPVSTPAVYSPSGIAAALLSAVAAKELTLISAPVACDRIRDCIDLLTRLPMPLHLPCCKYNAEDLQIISSEIETEEVGLLMTALMTAGQAVRTWLYEIPPSCHTLPEQLDSITDSLDIHQLYDTHAGLFYRHIDKDGSPVDHITHFADAALLLSIAASAKRLIPPEHFLRLSHTAIQAGHEILPLSRHGDLAAYLLPSLFIPLEPAVGQRIVRLHQHYGIHGLWGRSASSEHAFTPDLTYRQRCFGLQAIASEDVPERPVFAPYAAALALTCAPDAAVRCLRAMQQLGAFSPNGFYDAVDLSSGTAQIVRTHIALHQGILLCASAHVLADAPLMRFFCAIPAVEATLPLLHAQSAAPLTLPPRPIHAHAVPAYVSQERTADTSAQPVDAHLMGSDGASLAVTASGSSLMQLDGLPVTRFSGLPGELDGLQIYLIDESGAYRVTDPALPGKTTFGSGFARFIRRCGSLQTTLTIFHDPVHKRFFHLLEVTNLATADRTIELADFLWGDLGAAADTLEASRPEPYHACLTDRASGTTLHHRVALSQPPASTCLCTDARAFLGRGRTLADPASLEEPMADLAGSSCASCLSFRIQAVIGGRGQLRMLLSTALNDAPLPTWQELPGCMTLSTLHARAIAEAIPLPPPLEAAASRAVGAILWRGQAHQGARSPVDAALLKELLLPEEPLVTIAVPDESSLPRLTECLAIAAWFSLHGCPLTLYLLCSEETAPLAETALHDAFPTRSTESMAHILTDVPSDTGEALFAASRFVLRGNNRSLTAQLDSLRRPIPLPQRPQAAPEPGELPARSLAYFGSCGGFEPDTGDYCLQLAAHQTTPLSWPIRHAGDGFAFTADETGFLHPFGEQLSLSIDGSAPIPLPGSSLPRSIRIGNGLTRWRVHARDFRATLTAGCIVGAAAGLRSVHIRNLTDAPFTCVLTVSAAIGSSPLHCLTALDDAVVVENCIPAAFVAAAEGDWKALCSDDPHNACGRCAVLRASFTLEAHASADMAWISGTLQELEELARLQLTLHQQGISATLRQRAQTLAAALQPLTASTPEPTLDLLVNHLLPRQLLASGSAAYPPAVRMLFSPPEARNELLQTLGASALPDERLLLTMQVCRYVECTGDVSIFSASVADGVSIADLLREDLFQIKLDKTSLPVTDDAICTVFMAAVAAGCLAGSAGDSPLTSHRLSLLNAADTLLWHTDHYGVSDALRLDVQAWAALAYGDTPRTKRCLRACLDALCDREQGVLRLMRPTDTPACPGTPGNGGQSTRAAVLFLAALLKVGMHDSAWELLRMLNPIHHCDDPLRSEVYQGAPWFLSDGLHAAPSESGRSTNVPDDRSAAWLEEIIMTRMLGLTRSGDQLHMSPIVPPDWDDFCITLQIGSATWRIECSRDTDALLIDGVPSREGGFCPADDGRIHHIRCPIT